jgi:hypothetical protein
LRTQGREFFLAISAGCHDGIHGIERLRAGEDEEAVSIQQL